MSIVARKNFSPLQLTTSSTQIFALSTAADNVLRNLRVRLFNTNALSVGATLNAVPYTGSVAPSNTFFDGSVPAKSYIDVDVPKMQSGDMLYALAATGAAITMLEMDGVVTTLS